MVSLKKILYSFYSEGKLQLCFCCTLTASRSTFKLVLDTKNFRCLLESPDFANFAGKLMRTSCLKMSVTCCFGSAEQTTRMVFCCVYEATAETDTVKNHGNVSKLSKTGKWSEEESDVSDFSGTHFLSLMRMRRTIVTLIHSLICIVEYIPNVY